MLVSIPTQELNEPCPIFDMACPKSAMRMALFLTPENYLKLDIVDYMGKSHSLLSHLTVEKGGPVIIVVSIEPRDNLTTDVRVVAEDQDVILHTTDAPVEFYQDVYAYAVAFNKLLDREGGSPMSIGIGRLRVYQDASWSQRGHNLLALAGIRDQPSTYRWLKPGQSAFKPAGQKEFIWSDVGAMEPNAGCG